MSSTTQTSQLEVVRPDPNACFPKHSPAWRWNVATYVCDWYSGDPPNSDDPWVQEAATFLRQCLRGWSDAASEPTETQHDIADACRLCLGGAVQLAILKARLLADESPSVIEQRSGIPARVVETFEKLLFNVSQRECRDQICFSLVRPDRLLQKPDIGSYLLMKTRTTGAEGLERTVALLGRLDGRTMADGLPAEHSDESLAEISLRLDLAAGLRLLKKKQLKQLGSLMPCRTAAANAEPGMQVTLDEILSDVRVPKDIRLYARAGQQTIGTKSLANKRSG